MRENKAARTNLTKDIPNKMMSINTPVVLFLKGQWAIDCAQKVGPVTAQNSRKFVAAWSLPQTSGLVKLPPCLGKEPTRQHGKCPETNRDGLAFTYAFVLLKATTS